MENSSGKKRLVVNMRHVNKFLLKRRYKYEDMRVAMMLFEQGELMFTFDLKSGYHHVEIAAQHYKYLGLEWNNRFYVFTVLPFGLAAAPYVFTKLLRPLVRLWRNRGLKAVLYLDDDVFAVHGVKEANKASQLVQDTLVKAGLLANEEKSVWVPSPVVTWLGFIIDLQQGCVLVPDAKLAKLQLILQAACRMAVINARALASLGKILSMSLALGPVARLMTRCMYVALEGRTSWCDMLHVTDEVRGELCFWAKSLVSYNGQPIRYKPSAVRVVYSDASNVGYGGYIVEHGPLIANGSWSAEEATRSSTWRELVAVSWVLESMVLKLSGERVRWFTDNLNIVHILKVGSRKPHLHDEVLKIFNMCVEHQIKLEPEWVPREKNTIADCISRIVDYDDWQLVPEVFSWLNGQFGPFSVDRFASQYNTQLPRFNSRYVCPNSEAIDAFTVDWGEENNWLCPPPSLIVRVLRHARQCRAHGMIVIPCWPSAPFWPLVCSGSRYASFVLAAIELGTCMNVFIPGRSGACMLSNTPVLAMKIAF